MAEHTPGPWSVTPSGLILGDKEVWTNGRQRNEAGISSASYSKHIATINGDITLPAPKANAHLIASAPRLKAERDDLLRACEAGFAEICGGCHQEAGPCKPGNGMDNCCAAETANAMRAVINLAKGVSA